MRFKAPWGTPLKLISLFLCALCLGLATFGLIGAPERFPFNSILMVLVPLLGLAACACFTIRGYRLAGGYLFIQRLGWETSFSLRGLQSVTADPGVMRGSLRLFGNGGAFSISGVYWNRRLGRYRAFVTDMHRTVVLRWSDRVMVVSPDSPERFVETVKESSLFPSSPGLPVS